MLEKTEHYCWVRAVRHADAAQPSLSPAPKPSRDELNQLFARVRNHCPEISWYEEPGQKAPPPPAAVRIEPASQLLTTRHVLAVQKMTTVHLEQPVQGVFPVEIELHPVFGDKNEAIRWIESAEGEAFCSGAEAVSLLCFGTVGGA